MPAPNTSEKTSQLSARIQALPQPFAAITAYDYPSARLADEAGIEVILVGDSVGMVVAGMEDTTGVTMEQMCYHTEIVCRGVNHAIVVADLPIHSYDTPEMSVENGHRLMAAGADAVKLEGGLGQIDKVAAMVAADIPVVGHLGMLPQRVREEGGYKKKGKTQTEATALLEAAVALAEAGVLMIVLESVLADSADPITDALSIPTIGIGSGRNCSAQIRVWHDVVGAYPWFVPPFAKTYTHAAEQIREALSNYRRELL